MNKDKYIQQTILYGSFVAMIYSLTFGFEWSVLLWLVVANMLVGLLISAYYHRMLSHATWRPHPWVEVVLAVMAAGHAFAPAISWVAVHRKHHRFTDTEDDPHGPRRSLMANSALAFYDADLKYAGKLLRSKLYQFQLRYYFHIIVVYAAVWAYLFGLQSWAIIVGHVLVTQTSVNYFSHSADGAVNNKWVAPVLHGEMYHRNHHDAPNNVRFGKWDIPYLFIQALRVDR